jgi:hypothetical protein
MTKLATFDPSTGALTARYDTTINTIIPAAAVPLDDATFQRTINEQDGTWTLGADGSTVTKVLPTTAQLLAAKKTAQAATISATCQAAIVAGFTSSALGTAHTYPSNLVDQQNLAANVLASLLPGLPAGWTTLQMCADSNGVWSYVSHTAAQIQQVGTDAKSTIMALLVRNATAQTNIAAATTVAAVQAVTF